MDINELKKKYKNEWLLIEVLKSNELGIPTEGNLILHSKNRYEIDEKQKGMKDDLYITYTGRIPEKGYAVIL
ncbi:MAG: hypothetical protein AB1630_01860 [bacterium]